MSGYPCGCDIEANNYHCASFPNCGFGRTIAEPAMIAAAPGDAAVSNKNCATHGHHASWCTTPDACRAHHELKARRAFLEESTQPAAMTLIEAWRLTHGDRKSSYGQVEQAFARYAKVWSGLLANKLREDLTASDVALLMTGLKLAREMNKQQSDNVIDAHGYLILHDEIIKASV